MPQLSKPIRFSNHALIQLNRRGAHTEEVLETIRHSKWLPADLGKLECRKDFAFNQPWNGKLYPTKQIRPIFADEENEIVVITVYVYYF